MRLLAKKDFWMRFGKAPGPRNIYCSSRLKRSAICSRHCMSLRPIPKPDINGSQAKSSLLRETVYFHLGLLILSSSREINCMLPLAILSALSESTFSCQFGDLALSRSFCTDVQIASIALSFSTKDISSISDIVSITIWNVGNPVIQHSRDADGLIYPTGN